MLQNAEKIGGTVAEWSEAPNVRENYQKPIDLRFASRPGQYLKTTQTHGIVLTRNKDLSETIT